MHDVLVRKKKIRTLKVINAKYSNRMSAITITTYFWQTASVHFESRKDIGIYLDLLKKHLVCFVQSFISLTCPIRSAVLVDGRKIERCDHRIGTNLLRP